MAITAVVTLTPSAVTNPLAFDVGCAISNSGSDDVNVTGVHPTCATASGPAATVLMGKPLISPGQNVIVPASGSLTLHWGCYLPAPRGSSAGFASTPSSQTYTIGATILTSDGSLTNATTDSMVVTAPTAT